MEDTSDTHLQNSLIALVRAFGLHHPEQTPCGQSVAVAEAHALMELVSVQSLLQGELGKRLNLEKSTISRLVSILEKRGWIKRDRNLADRRVVEISLTDIGKQMAEKLSITRQAKFSQLISAVPEDQQANVTNALNILVKAIRESQ